MCDTCDDLGFIEAESPEGPRVIPCPDCSGYADYSTVELPRAIERARAAGLNVDRNGLILD